MCVLDGPIRFWKLTDFGVIISRGGRLLPRDIEHAFFIAIICFAFTLNCVSRNPPTHRARGVLGLVDSLLVF